MNENTYGSSAVTQTATHGKLIGSTIPALSSPSSILLICLTALSFPPGKSRRTFHKGC